ncbi:MAG TPA: saccharopine dehydrogenase, partial [Saprospiraceae bacterium]|nr:saccharopine dehydrogenase [Saprospiraceae bacterium]
GMGNIILGYHDRSLEIEEFLCLVGGLPKKREWPFEYKAPFSPIDVLEEYTRPARYVENGSLVVKEALSDSEFVDFENIGTLEAFNTDGLRSLIYTMPHIPNMKEKTLRYPGHIEYIKVLKKAGFFKNEMINIGGASLSPMEFTSKILLDSWKLGEYEEELTVMEITIKGKDKLTKKPVEIKYNLYDEYDVKTNTSSMARTTGYTATAVVNLVLDGLFSEKGIFPPELLGNNEICYNFVMKYLNDRGVVYEKVEK